MLIPLTIGDSTHFERCNMEIRKCTIEDIGKLAQLNKQLIEDEQSNNKMSVQELTIRMMDYITGDYDAYFFENDHTILGYGLIDKTRTPLYLKQFLIKRGYRRKGYGKTAFDLLLHFLSVDGIELEVLSLNKRGTAFWQSLGFTEISKYMRLISHKRRISPIDRAE